MQNQVESSATPKANNVITLGRKTKDPVVQDGNLEEAQPSFEEIMRRNIENRDRLAKERAKANQSVIKSYRLKT